MLFDTKKCKQETLFLLGSPFGPEAGPFTSTFTLGALTSTSGTFTRIGRPLPEPPDPDPCPDPRLEPRPDPRPDPFVDVAVTATVNVINQTYMCDVRYMGKNPLSMKIDQIRFSMTKTSS